jgi:hypothetical protein
MPSAGCTGEDTIKGYLAQQGSVCCGQTDCSAGAMLSIAAAVLNWLGPQVSLMQLLLASAQAYNIQTMDTLCESASSRSVKD